MLPINLLPNYIFDRNKKRNAAIVYGAAIAGIIVAFVVWSQSVQAKLNEEKTRLETANTLKGQYDGVVKNIQDVNNQIAVTKSKQDFVANAQTWNNAWPAAYDQLRNLTSPWVLLKSMSVAPDRKTVTVTGFAANELLIAKWWMALKSHPEIFSNVTMQLPTHPYIPAGATANAGGMGGYPGSMGGMPGSGGGGMMGRPMASGMSASGMPSSGGGSMGGYPGMAGGGGGARNAEVGPAMIEDRPGINFVATATLVHQLAESITSPGVPTWPSGGAAPAPGGANGFPGGMSGMPMSGGMGGSAGMAGSGGMRGGKGGAD